MAISAADLDSAPTSSARLASAAAPAVQRAGAPTPDSGSRWLNLIGRLHHAGRGDAGCVSDGLGGPGRPGRGIVVAADRERLATDAHRDVVPAPETFVECVSKSGSTRVVDGLGDEPIEVDDPVLVGDRRTVVDDQVADAQRRRPVDRSDRIAVAPRSNAVDIAVMVAALRCHQALVPCARAGDGEECIVTHGGDVHLLDGDRTAVPPPDETERSGQFDRGVEQRHDAGIAEHGVHAHVVAADRAQHLGGDLRLGVW